MKDNILLLLRFLIAAIFIVSGTEKLMSPAENFLYVLQAYNVFPDILARFFAVGFPWMELSLGVFMAVGLWLRLSLLAVACVSSSFILVVGQAIVRKLPIDNCGCFGSLVHLPLHGVIFLDTAILLSALACFFHISSVRRFSLDNKFDAIL
ncbi:MAG: DoxX family membrane protein [Candidatus Omnitrophica bacterium]|nr:DoxX family membrane protein [Candidatus Omnitrophota bacterium]